MKLISYMVGSEVRWLTETFPTDFRKIPYITLVKFRAWVLRPFIQEYWVDNEYLVQFIKKFKENAKTRVVEEPFKYNVKLPKKEHIKFTVLYYYPKNPYNKTYCEWVYGLDIFNALVERLPAVKWIVADGTIPDMNEVYPIVDFYLRPNRHDGDARMRRESEVQEIPYYWTQHDPNVDDAFKAIQKAFNDRCAELEYKLLIESRELPIY